MDRLDKYKNKKSNKKKNVKKDESRFIPIENLPLDVQDAMNIRNFVRHVFSKKELRERFAHKGQKDEFLKHLTTLVKSKNSKHEKLTILVHIFELMPSWISGNKQTMYEMFYPNFLKEFQSCV